ncbi:hypothetical protein BKA64DRAFT_145627 [Cadophora sp. MPI-SDFR-AT-0126]|nr:hypothetical protein BKA64DRAFT_145627 [Leotiomycetes sp. MPI-SDFR-AT-0126]
MPPSKPKPRAVPQAAGFNTFKVSKQTSGRVRARLGPEERQKVAAMRNLRACLRCSLARVKCTPGDICANCSNLAGKKSLHNRILPFAACIRTKLHEVSPFESYLPSNDSDSLDLILAKSDVLASTEISLDFAHDVTWNTEALVNDIVQWLNNPLLSNTSKVGTMSSPEFLHTILDSSTSLDEKSGMNFQLMLYATSLAHIQQTAPNNHEYSITDLLQIGSVAGHNFLKYLDDKFKPQKLAKCTGDDIRALFLLAFGTILAVGYADDKAVNVRTPEKQRQFKAMQEHICQILAHYVTYLGSQLGLPLAGGTERFMLEAAPEKWRKQGIFRWSSPFGGPQGFDVGAAEFGTLSGLGCDDSRFAGLCSDFGGVDYIQNDECMSMHTTRIQITGASGEFQYHDAPNGWDLLSEAHAAHESNFATPDFCSGFLHPGTLDPPSGGMDSAISDSNPAHLNAWKFIDSVAEAGCTCRVLVEPERTEHLLV